LILGGAAVYRCGKSIVLNPALAAEVALSAREQLSRSLLEAAKKARLKERLKTHGA
jgi:hypothetical protein